MRCPLVHVGKGPLIKCETLLKSREKVVKCDDFSVMFHAVAKQADKPAVFLVFLGSFEAHMKAQTTKDPKGPL